MEVRYQRARREVFGCFYSARKDDVILDLNVTTFVSACWGIFLSLHVMPNVCNITAFKFWIFLKNAPP
jgi:hypothetical protein